MENDDFVHSEKEADVENESNNALQLHGIQCKDDDGMTFVDGMEESEIDVKNREGSSERQFETFAFAGEEDTADRESQDLSAEIEKWVDGSKVCTSLVKKPRSFVCVDYPGLIKNPQVAYRTLGEQSGIQKALRDKLKMELRFRPEDPYSKPTIGSHNKANNLLIKILRRKAAESTFDGFEYRMEVIGRVNHVYAFDNPCDFQYLPVFKNADGQHQEILSSIQLQLDDEREEYLSRRNPLYLPPSSFCRREMPGKYFLEDDGSKGSRTNKEEKAIIKTERIRNKFGTVFCDPSLDDIPTGPSVETRNNMLKFKEVIMESACKAIRKVFELRPMWSRHGLLAHLDPKHHNQERYCTPMVAYHITMGPWRSLWCKFGYNPCQEKKAKIYQVVDFRIRDKIMKNRLERKRNTTMPRAHHDSSAYRDYRSAAIHRDSEQGSSSDNTDDPRKNLTYMYYPEFPPPYRQIKYQVCDVMEAQVQSLLHKNDGQETTCSDRDGWCVPDFTDLCRDIISKRTEALFSGSS